MRDVTIHTDFTMYAPGSVLICTGNTRVICTASIENSVPQFLAGTGRGWVTAEYAMLPGATPERTSRRRNKGADGRSTEIQRLIGRSLRTCVDGQFLGERTIWIDCDVIQADAGTRCASITGGAIALAMACRELVASGSVVKNPFVQFVAAVSTVVFQGEIVVDPCYEEDSGADVDMNIIMNEKGEFVEIQGTGEKKTFSSAQLNTMIEKGSKAIQKLIVLQKKTLSQS